MPLDDAQLLARMNSRISPTGALLGFKLLEVDSARGFVRIEYLGKPEFCNPMGNIQGGFVAAMLDDAAAISAIVKSGRRIAVPTLEFKTSFFAPAKVGPLFAEGRCLRVGRTVAFMEADLFDPDARHLARMTTTVLPVEVPDAGKLVDRG